MIVNEYPVSCPEAYFPLTGADPAGSVFFDIETTGFRASSSHLYLIGAAVRSGGGWRIVQWMSERPQEEAGLLRVFAQFIRPYQTLIHFNGERFDLPYLREKYAQYGLPSPLDTLSSVDLYQDVRPLKSLLGLSHMNQKSLERFLGLRREDRYDGGALIRVYRDFCREKSDAQCHLLLLHNREDVMGMLSLLPLYAYLDAKGLVISPAENSPGISATIIRSAEISSAKMSSSGTSSAETSSARIAFAEMSSAQIVQAERLTLSWPLSLPVPVPFRQELSDPGICFESAQDIVSLHLPLLQGSLLYFFENYRDYYYLPAEDRAIHKSVSSFVAKEYRRQASARTCYVRQKGSYLPQPTPEITPALKRSYDDPLFWFSLREEQLQDPGFLKNYRDTLLTLF